MLAWRAASTAARSRGLAAGSGNPVRADVVNSRMSLVKILPRFLSCAPLRYMMFLNCEWPAISAGPNSFRYGLHNAGPTHPSSAILALQPATCLTIQYGRIGASPAQPRRSENRRCARRYSLQMRQVWCQPAADPYRLDPPGQTGRLVDLHEGAAHGRFAVGRLRLLARHFGDEPVHRRGFLQADDRIVVAAHAEIAEIRRAAGQDLRIRGRHMGVRADHRRDPTIGEMAERHLLAGRLAVKIDDNGIGAG